MKKLIFALSSLTLIGGIYFADEKKTESKSPATVLSTVEVYRNQPQKIKESKLAVVEIKDLEQKVSGLSEEEIQDKIKLNNQMAHDLDLFARANNGNLDDKLSLKMVEYIRVNRVLHQALMDRLLDDAERDLL